MAGSYLRNKVIDQPWASHFKKYKPRQLLGFELEVEGDNLPEQDHLRYHWFAERDGSLREGGREYVLKNPVYPEYFKEKCFPYLVRAFNRVDSNVDMTLRCSAHVHINTHALAVYQVYAMAVLYYAYEKTFLQLTTSEREGNVFCVGASDSSMLAEDIRSSLRDYDQMLGFFHNTETRYTAVNFNSLIKFGTLEFRALHGTLDEKTIYDWIDILLALRQFCSTLEPEDMSRLLGSLSEATPSEYLKRILSNPELYRTLRELSGGDEAINQQAYEGIFNIQSVIYQFNWTKAFEAEDLKMPERFTIEHWHAEVPVQRRRLVDTIEPVPRMDPQLQELVRDRIARGDI